MARLLKPGFHSGTLPKRYAKLRRAERHARAGGNWHAVHKHLQALHRIEVSIRRYVEREFLELFAESKCWQAPPVTLEAVRLGTNSVRLALGCPGIAEPTLQIAMEVEVGLARGRRDRSRLDRPAAAAPAPGAGHGAARPLQVGGHRSGAPADRGAVPAARAVVRRFRGGAGALARRGGGRGSALRSSERPVDCPAVGSRLGAAAAADGRAAAARFLPRCPSSWDDLAVRIKFGTRPARATRRNRSPLVRVLSSEVPSPSGSNRQ